MWNTLLGGFLAIIASFVATWFQQRKIVKTRMNEIVAERKISANADAYSYAKEIRSYLSQQGPLNASKLILSREEWFFSQRLFLPGSFPEKWLTARNNLPKLVQLEQSENKKPKEIAALKDKIDKFFRMLFLKFTKIWI